jgi:hypothetical protein
MPDTRDRPNPLRARAIPGGIEVWRADGDEPLLVQHAEPDRRPYIHPILAPDAAGYATEDAPADAPGHGGLFVGLRDVNGVDFWNVRPAGDAPGGGAPPHRVGTFHPLPLGPQHLRRGGVLWSVITDWRAPDGASLLGEAQRWSIDDFGGAYALDLLWTLSANADLTFGRSPDGGLFLRTPWRPSAGGAAVNSEGRTNRDADGRRARWLAVSGPIPDRPPGPSSVHGIALFDHPDNPEHPTPWRVDDQFGVGPARSAAGAWHLSAGEMVAFRYRLFIYGGNTDAAAVEAGWREFARQGGGGGAEADDADD